MSSSTASTAERCAESSPVRRRKLAIMLLNGACTGRSKGEITRGKQLREVHYFRISPTHFLRSEVPRIGAAPVCGGESAPERIHPEDKGLSGEHLEL